MGLFLPFWPRSSFSYAHRIKRAMIKELSKNAFDYVVAVNSPIDVIIASSMTKKRFPGVTFIDYFLDPIAFGKKPSFMKEEERIKFEERYLKNADAIVMMDSFRPYYESLQHAPSYLSKTRFLDIPLIERGRLNTSPKIRPINTDKTIRFAYTGTLDWQFRDPACFLAAFASLEQQGLDYKLTIAGKCAEKSRLQRELGDSKNIHYVGVLSHAESLALTQSCDFAISLGNNIDSMVPSKIYELISRRKYIIHFSNSHNDPCIRYLDTYQNALIIPYMCANDDAVRAITNLVTSEIKMVDSMDNPLFQACTPERFLEVLTKEVRDNG